MVSKLDPGGWWELLRGYNTDYVELTRRAPGTEYLNEPGLIMNGACIQLFIPGEGWTVPGEGRAVKVPDTVQPPA